MLPGDWDWGQWIFLVMNVDRELKHGEMTGGSYQWHSWKGWCLGYISRGAAPNLETVAPPKHSEGWRGWARPSGRPKISLPAFSPKRPPPPPLKKAEEEESCPWSRMAMVGTDEGESCPTAQSRAARLLRSTAEARQLPLHPAAKQPRKAL